MRFGLLLIIVSIALAIVSCKKDKQENPAKKSVSELLTLSPWMISLAGFDDNDNGVVDPDENVLQDCDKDDTWIYNNDGTGSVHENANSCTPPNNNSFQWILKNNDTKIEINNQPYFIIQVTENKLILKADMPFFAHEFRAVYFR